MAGALKALGTNVVRAGAGALMPVGDVVTGVGRAVEHTGKGIKHIANFDGALGSLVTRSQLFWAEMCYTFTSRSEADTNAKDARWCERVLVNYNRIHAETPKKELEDTDAINQDALDALPYRPMAFAYSITNIALTALAFCAVLLSICVTIPGLGIEALGCNQSDAKSLIPHVGIQWFGNLPERVFNWTYPKP